MSQLQILRSLKFWRKKPKGTWNLSCLHFLISQMQRKETNHIKSFTFTYREHIKIPKIPYSRYPNLLLLSNLHKLKTVVYGQLNISFMRNPFHTDLQRFSQYNIKEGTSQTLIACQKIQQVTYKVIFFHFMFKLDLNSRPKTMILSLPKLWCYSNAGRHKPQEEFSKSVSNWIKTKTT